jgi:hypothetical protein
VSHRPRTIDNLPIIRNAAGAETRPPGCDSWWSLGGSVSHRPRTIDNLPIIRNTAGAETRPPLAIRSH